MASITNNEIKRIKSLSDKKFRDESGLFVVEGEKMVSEAQASGFKIESLYRKDEIGDNAMSRISSMSSPSPVLAVVHKPQDLVAESNLLKEGSRGLFLALDTIKDPGNMGTILRIADWFGVDMVVASHGSVDVFNPKVVQSTMGAIFRVSFHYTDIARFCEDAVKVGGKVYGTFLDGRDIYDRPLTSGEDSPSVIVIGNESNGISDEVAKTVTDRLFIPPYPKDDPGSESLNAAVATAVTVAEFRRRMH